MFEELWLLCGEMKVDTNIDWVWGGGYCWLQCQPIGRVGGKCPEQGSFTRYITHAM